MTSSQERAARRGLGAILADLSVRDSSSLRLSDLVSPRRQLIVALAIGATAAALSYALIGRPDYPSDFYHYWSATRTLIHGGDPYGSLPVSPMNPGGDPALYPVPAFLLLSPIALLPLAIAGGIFMGISSGLAAWGTLRTGAERLPLFLSAPFLLALSLGQWSPLLLAAVLVPTLTGVVLAKPNVGLAVFVARPSVRGMAVAVALLIVSFIVMPDWLPRWLGNLTGREEKLIPFLQPGGFLLALAAVCWRRPESRLLLVLSAVPQAIFFYDQLLLWLIPRTLRQSMMLSLWSLGAFLLWRIRLEPGDFYVQEAIPFAHSLYFAALAILLWNWFRARRDRTGAAP